MSIILIVLIVILLYMPLMFYRNNWVYKQRIAWNNEVYKYIVDLIWNDHDKYRKTPSQIQLFNSIASYDVMLINIFKWRLESFVTNWDNFNLVRHNQPLHIDAAKQHE